MLSYETKLQLTSSIYDHLNLDKWVYVSEGVTSERGALGTILKNAAENIPTCEQLTTISKNPPNRRTQRIIFK